MFDLNRIIRPHLKTLQPYSSARDEYTGAEGVFLDANENSLGSATDQPFNRYPDPYQRKLKGKISEIKEVAVSNLFLGNGSDEPIDLLFRAFCEPGIDNVVINPPTYGMYQVSADIHNIETRKVTLIEGFQLDLGGILSAIDENTKILWICSPNNPTGNLMNADSIVSILTRFDGIVVVDEAYIDFAVSSSWVDSLSTYSNLVVLQTFSKAWGLAGLRLGAAYANPQIIELLNKIKAPYNLSQSTQEVALEALSGYEKVLEMSHDLVESRKQLELDLSRLNIVDHIYPSDANFLLVKFQKPELVFRFLIDRKVIVRDRSKVVLCEGGLRITVGSNDENKKLLETLQEFSET